MMNNDIIIKEKEGEREIREKKHGKRKERRMRKLVGKRDFYEGKGDSRDGGRRREDF